MKTVLLTGTLAAGKTTLLTLLSSCPIVRGVPEVARDLLREFPHLQSTAIFQKLIAEEQCRRENEARSFGSPLIVFDRGAVDIRAYSRYFGHEPPLPESRCNYDYVFLCDPRDIDCDLIPQRFWEMRSAIDPAIRNQLAELRIEYHVLRGSPLERCKTLAAVVAPDLAPADRSELSRWLANASMTGAEGGRT